MIMIAVITINSGLVPLIEGLCAQILYYIFEIIGGLHIFCFYFSEEKTYYRKKQSVQELILPSSIYIHMCTLYTYTNICMSRFSPSGFLGPPGVSFRLLGSHPSFEAFRPRRHLRVEAFTKPTLIIISKTPGFKKLGTWELVAFKKTPLTDLTTGVLWEPGFSC